MPKSAEVRPTEADLAIARAALLEITTNDTIGDPAGSLVETDGSLTVYFENTMRGYVGWKWTVSISHAGDGEPSVLETELMPAEGALLAPDWVPWSERLADYKEAQAELAAHAAHDEDSDDDDDDEDADDDDDDDFDDDTDDDDVDALLHSGDLDGVDIDSLDEADDLVEPNDSVDSVDSQASALPAVSDDKPKKAKGKSDDTSPEPPVKPRRNQRATKQQHSDEGE